MPSSPFRPTPSSKPFSFFRERCDAVWEHFSLQTLLKAPVLKAWLPEIQFFHAVLKPFNLSSVRHGAAEGSLVQNSPQLTSFFAFSSLLLNWRLQSLNKGVENRGLSIQTPLTKLPWSSGYIFSRLNFQDWLESLLQWLHPIPNMPFWGRDLRTGHPRAGCWHSFLWQKRRCGLKFLERKKDFQSFQEEIKNQPSFCWFSLPQLLFKMVSHRLNQEPGILCLLFFSH